MRVLEAARLVSTGKLDPEILWEMTTLPERVAISLLLGRPELLPRETNTPTLARKTLSARYRDLVMRRAPVHVRRRLPGFTA
ncbi:hypothetical protein LOC54_01650 [Acetobacter sp. AN02]|uniref:hypothetical protein n=1 Tax=Acetobacter sp. AN02 TaxID=2894186 RepID=UPI0024343F0F|nr:hypothetical protein [Acetobacter sp. AN02]MDG6093827.1 hypothetical protein [Acetobacter sp. AN02]